MDEIVFPQYGRVAIVDDNYEEVRVIQNILAENGVPYIFYDYQTMQEVDIVQVEGIRLLFLDIRLEDGLSSEMNTLTVLASAVEKVIPANNGPYYIILWTNEAQMKNKVIEFLNERLEDNVTTKPVMIETEPIDPMLFCKFYLPLHNINITQIIVIIIQWFSGLILPIDILFPPL